ncbi:MAG: hypothetical protein JXA95_08490 [Spirochaetales bacterium]|nr:hypothetical protein [Spirochaetales bacterium]
MGDKIRKKTVALFLINILFWLGIFLYFSFFRFRGEGDYLILKILLSGEPVLFTAALSGYLRSWRIVPFLTLLFLAANVVLSLTDQVGLLDAVSLVLSGGLFVLLILQGKGKNTP